MILPCRMEITREFLQQVADEYENARSQGVRPKKHLERLYENKGIASVSRYIRLAREEGLLPPVKPGPNGSGRKPIERLVMGHRLINPPTLVGWRVTAQTPTRLVLEKED